MGCPSIRNSFLSLSLLFLPVSTSFLSSQESRRGNQPKAKAFFFSLSTHSCMERERERRKLLSRWNPACTRNGILNAISWAHLTNSGVFSLISREHRVRCRERREMPPGLHLGTYSHLPSWRRWPWERKVLIFRDIVNCGIIPWGDDGDRRGERNKREREKILCWGEWSLVRDQQGRRHLLSTWPRARQHSPQPKINRHQRFREKKKRETGRDRERKREMKLAWWLHLAFSAWETRRERNASNQAREIGRESRERSGEEWSRMGKKGEALYEGLCRGVDGWHGTCKLAIKYHFHAAQTGLFLVELNKN